MALEKFNGNVNVISNLADTPMMGAQKLKESFDAAGQALKEYLNDTLIPDLDDKFRDIDDQLEKIPDVVDSLESDDTKAALSAAMGKKLAAMGKQLIDGKQNKITVGTSAPVGGSDGDIYIRY